MTIALHARRRQRMLDALGATGAALLPSGRALVRSQTTHYPFRPDSDFYYLTGFREPDAALLLLPGHPQHVTVAFVRPRDPAAETWHGRRLGVEAAVEALGVDAAFPIDELEDRLETLLAPYASLCYPMGAVPALDARLTALAGEPRSKLSALLHPRALLHERRLFKDADELALMRQGAAITAAGFEAAIAQIRPGANEREVQAALEGTFRRLGAEGPAYGTIVAGGASATILHYTENDRPLEAGALVLVDAGAEFGFYASDVTRTFPVGGRFSPLQREVYAVVLEAQRRAIAALVPGAPARAYHEVADRALTEGLVALGALQGDPDALHAAGAHRRFTLHGAGHYLGLDTHDVGAYERPLAPGMVLTVEPGLYFPAEADVPPALRGIGIRIEDDVLVTEEGPEVLTEAIHRAIADVEAAFSATGRL